MTQPDSDPTSDARGRIVDASVRCIAREGMTRASMAAMAEEAGVSKALLHYHYHDRATLLAELALGRDGRVRDASRAVANLRRRRAASSVERLFAELGVTPPVPPALLADAVVAFVDGLALDAVVGSSREARVSFDVFWLALLGLTD